MHAPTFPNHLEQLERDGFAITQDVLSPSLVAALIEQFDSMPTDGAKVRKANRAIFARRNLLDLDWIRDLSGSTPIISIVREIVGDDALPVRAILFDKTADANWLVPWHQDLSIAVKERIDVEGFGPWSRKAHVAHVQPPLSILAKMLTVRLHLDACDENNGPLRVVPGTHRKLHRPEEIERLADEGPQVSCTVGAGGAILMRPMLLHASSPARNPAHRRVVHIEYAGGELPGGLQWNAL